MPLSSLARQDRYARAAWSRLAEPADLRALELIAAVGAAAALTHALSSDDPTYETFRMRAARLDLDRDLDIAHRAGARLLVPDDADWPAGVDDHPAPPVCLWVRGPALLGQLARRSVAVVGARACTAYGDQVATEFAVGLADRGVTVVSGAAYGVDGSAHRGALSVDGPTVAVLAGGVDRPYPAQHARLIDEIAGTGAVISEVPPGSAPTRPRFLLRNRLIASMTTGTVVVEAGLRSGSLNTARTAAEIGRPVGVVPGPITSMMSAGCHQARRDGYAEIVTDVDEVLDLVGAIGDDLAPRPSGEMLPTDGLEGLDAQVWANVPVRRFEPAEAIALAAGVTTASTIAALGRLELSGFVLHDAAGWRKAPAGRG